MFRKLRPGVYVETDGTLHLDLPEMCEAAGFEPTPANQAIIQRAFVDFAEAVGIVPEVEEINVGGRGVWRG